LVTYRSERRGLRSLKDGSDDELRGRSLMPAWAPAGRPARVLLLGGTSEIGLAILAALDAPPGTEVLLAGRDEERLTAAAKQLRYAARTLPFDATALATHQRVIDDAFADGPVDLLISAAGVLIPQPDLDRDPLRAGLLVDTNFTAHVTTILAAVARMRAVNHGTIIVLSSVAAVRPRKANFVYGAAKAGLDAFARGLADALHGTGIRVLLVRPGFVLGRMTAGMPAAPLSSTPAQVGTAVAAALAAGRGEIWVPRALGPFAAVMRLLPRPVWRRLRR
jgi:decaprenylphospho-beta-D-erythro-pentofuranosid-2-ulose 2-reductase